MSPAPRRSEGAWPSLRVLIIIPAFNEAKNLGAVLTGLRGASPECDVCVVDDGSTDETAKVAAREGATVLRVPLNLGIGGAVQTGYLWAQRRGYDVAIQIDGDGQHDPRFIADVLAPIARGEADLVIGSRFLDAGGYRSTAIRRLGIRYLSWFIRARCGVRVTDPTSGFRATGRRAIELFARTYPDAYPEAEAIGLARRHGLGIVEVPVRMSERIHGASTINGWRSIQYFVMVSLALALWAPADGSGRGPSPDGEE
ncbi:MAG TPA: glycosyltransferase family 2 protein [Methylomirabilota bacterium]|nr:glycosyltransferase family 2 protein [Methylomirabilota bacterium]